MSAVPVLACDDAGIAEARRRLLAGGLVAVPTETVYGLAADATNRAAVRRIFEVKGRPADHPLIVHVHDAAELDRWARSVPQWAQELAEVCWPGPLTLVVERASGVLDEVTGGLDTVAVRVPDHPATLAILESLAGVAAPSANRFGKVSPTTAAHVVADLGADLDPERDAVLDGGPCRVGVESTIVEAIGDTPVLLRPGQISGAEIEAICERGVRRDDHGPARAPGMLAAHYAPSAAVHVVDAGEWPAALAESGAVAYLGAPRAILPAAVVALTAPDPYDGAGLAPMLYACAYERSMPPGSRRWSSSVHPVTAWAMPLSIACCALLGEATADPVSRVVPESTRISSRRTAHPVASEAEPMNDEDRDYGVLVLGVLAAVLFLIVGWSTGLVPGNPMRAQTVATTVAATHLDLVADTEAALAGVSSEKLALADGSPIRVSLGDGDGVIVLEGEVASESIKAQAAAVAAAVEGVRSVDNRLTVAELVVETTAAAETTAVDTVAMETAAVEPAPPSATPVAVNASVGEDGSIVLSGAVPTEDDKSAIGEAVQGGVPAGTSVDNQLTIDSSTQMAGGTFTLTGRARPELAGALAAVASGPTASGLGLNVDNQVESIAAPKLETDINALFATSPIQFASGSAEITAASAATLDQAAELLKADAAGAVAIEGHTDDVGDPTTNLALSQERADAVLSGLVDRGVDANRLTAKGFGDARPIADNATAEGKATNRRVVVVVTTA